MSIQPATSNLFLRLICATAAVVLAASSSLSVGCASSAAAAAVVDDFDGPAGAAPNPQWWSHVTGRGWDIGIETYASSRAFLDGQGHLAIEAVEGNGGYQSGRIQTKGKLSLGYGTFSARIKMPAGQGLWPAFWLFEDGDPHGVAEIDIIELVSNATTYYSTIHGPKDGGGMYQVQSSGGIPDLSAGFHNYWATHAPDRVTIGIDGRTLATFTPESLPPGGRWVFNKPMYAILTLAVGGTWAGPPDASTRFPATMLVDWFRWDPL